MKIRQLSTYLPAALVYIFRKKLILNSNIDKNAVVRSNCRVYSSTIGRFTYITRGCLVQKAIIGSFCSIAEGCYIGMPNHPIDMVSTSPVFLENNRYLKKNFAQIQYLDCEQTIIGNDVWIGNNVKIKAGIIIGNGAIIATGAVVTHNVPAYAIVAGVPAKIIRYRFENKVANGIEKSEWWNWSEEELCEMGDCFQSVELFLERTRL